ncbi:MAG: PAS domain S-box protein [Gemmatimonadota bacterium]|nr:PAS domain S-box protein [Gemmatimonadota bacterium]
MFQEALRRLAPDYLRTHQILELVGDGIIVLDAGLTVVFANASALQILGTVRERLQGCKAFPQVVAADRVLALRMMRAALQRRHARVVDVVRIQTPSGVERHVEAIAINALDEMFIGGIVVTIRDVSDRERAKAALRQRDLEYRDLFEYAADGIATVDRNGYVTAVNAQLPAMTGFAADQLVSRSVFELYVADDAHAAAAGLRLLARGANVLGERRLASANGSEIPVEVHARRISETTIHAVFRDIRDRKAQEERSQRVRALESMAVLAAGVGHDFNNLLTVINGCIAGVMDGAATSDAERREMRDDLEDALAKAARLASRLTKSGRTATLVPGAGATNLWSLTDQAMRAITRILPPTVRLEVTGDDVPPAHAHHDVVEECLLNLVTNAIAAMPDGGTLTIRPHLWTEPAGGKPTGCIALSVEDTGAGMDEDTIRRVFEPYFTTKAPQGGTGLGLFMVQSLMHQMGGRVAIVSRPGAGTKVSLLFRSAAKEISAPDAPNGGATP